MYLKAGAVQFSRHYLLALALRSLKDFGVVSVRHCQPEKYYKHLLEPVTGPTTKQKRKRGEHAFTFEVDAGALALEGAAATAAAAPVVQTVQRRVRGTMRGVLGI